MCCIAVSATPCFARHFSCFPHCMHSLSSISQLNSADPAAAPSQNAATPPGDAGASACAARDSSAGVASGSGFEKDKDELSFSYEGSDMEEPEGGDAAESQPAPVSGQCAAPRTGLSQVLLPQAMGFSLCVSDLCTRE